MDQSTYEVHEARPQRNAAPLQAKTEGQLKLIRAIKESDQVIVTGPAGTGKSFIPAAMAADYLAQGHIEKIVLIRPMVSVGRTMGFLPGTQDEKLAPWMIPLTEPLQERLGKGYFEYCIKTGKIEMAPLESMRGRTFHDAMVILDEAQNASLHELKLLLTRMGRGKLIIDGDVGQTDLHDQSGLRDIVRLADDHDIDCRIVTLGLEDVVRSGVVKQWLMAFYREGI